MLNKFPAPYKPRPVQTKCLTELAEAWEKYDVFVVNLPVASGKSYIAKTIADFTGAAAIITPTNLLVDQYRADFPKLAGIYGKKSYSCKEKGYSNCASRTGAYARAKVKPMTCPGCPWLTDTKKIRSRYVTRYVTNYHLYAQLRKFQPTLIVDEAHNLTSFLQDRHAVRISRDKYKYPVSPSGYIDRDELLVWLKSLVGIDKILAKPAIGQKALKELYNELTTEAPRYLLKEETETKRTPAGTFYEKRYLKLCPIDVRDMPPVLWPGGVRKIVLMSATINKKDIEEIGLSEKRVKYISADSCIPAENRPVNYTPVAEVTGKNLEASAEIIAAEIIRVLEKNEGDKGVIHATYAQAAVLKSLLGGHPRLLWHTRENKKQVYASFREINNDKVLVASGLYEGIDLPEDAGRFQIITKVPWPNLGEPAVKYRSNIDPDWYGWQAVKTMLQACGRISRKPDDYGETIIVDSTFKRLYDNNKGMFPEWFNDGLTGVGDE